MESIGKDVFNDAEENICPSPSKEEPKSPKEKQYDTFQNWATHNYGETSKTKTVTGKKYNRIRDVLAGTETPSAENAKFRFWVKAKGFKLGPSSWRNGLVDCKELLYVPTKMQTAHGTVKEFKRVARVEDFFDIIYSMHVDPDCRGGKHAGQKRTYRAISETYAFLPREAVTRFLMSCTDCQKRMHLSPDITANPIISPSSSPHISNESEENSSIESDFDTSMLDYNVPITTTYLNHIKRKSHKKPYEMNVGIGLHQDQIGVNDKYLLQPYNCNNENQDNNKSDVVTNYKTEGAHTDFNISVNDNLMMISDDNFKAENNNRHQDMSPKTQSRVGKALSSFLGRKYKSSVDTPIESSASMKAHMLYKPYEITPNAEATKIQMPVKNHSPLAGTVPPDHSLNTKYTVRGHTDMDHHGNLQNDTWRKQFAASDTLYYMNPNMPYMAQAAYPANLPERDLTNDNSNEPTNLSTKKTRPESVFKPYHNNIPNQQDFEHQSQIKLLTIRQLILGYRESAAFLYRSAQELEQLLIKYS